MKPIPYSRWRIYPHLLWSSTNVVFSRGICATVAIFVLYNVSGLTVLSAYHMKRCRKSWRKRWAIKIGQKALDFREKRKLSCIWKMGRSNKMVNRGGGGSIRPAFSDCISLPTYPALGWRLMASQAGPKWNEMISFIWSKKAAKL